MMPQGLYKALAKDGNPSLATVLKVMKALGLKMSAEAARARVTRARFEPFTKEDFGAAAGPDGFVSLCANRLRFRNVPQVKAFAPKPARLVSTTRVSACDIPHAHRHRSGQEHALPNGHWSHAS